MPSITIPVKKGYFFNGYFTQPEGNGDQYYTSKGTSAKNWIDINGKGYRQAVSTAVCTLYAHWILVKYGLDYENLQGSKFPEDVVSRYKSESLKSLKGRRKYVSEYNVNSEDVILEDPYRKGMEFVGWVERDDQ